MTTDLHFCPGEDVGEVGQGEEGGEGGGRKRGRGGQLVRRNTLIKAPIPVVKIMMLFDGDL
jgi:hypothetical protein